MLAKAKFERLDCGKQKGLTLETLAERWVKLILAQIDSKRSQDAVVENSDQKEARLQK